MEMTMMQDKDIQELLQVLRLFQKGKEEGEVFELVTYIDGLENKLGQVLEELTTVKKQLVEIREINEKKSLKEVLSDSVEKLEENCRQIKESLIEIKNEVREKAKEVVQSVKEKGISGLNKLAGFLGIRDKLSKMKNDLEQNISHVETAMERIDTAGLQFRKAATDIRNVGRALSGKEMAETKEKTRFSLADVIKAPWKMKRKLFGGMLSRVESAMEKAEGLSKKAESIELEKGRDKASPTSYEEKRQDFIETHVVESGSYMSNSEAFEAFQNAYDKKAGNEIDLQTSNKNLDRSKVI